MMQWLNGIDQIKDGSWQCDYPFLGKGFINALEKSNSINGDSGWNSHYLSVQLESLNDQSIDNNTALASEEIIIPAFVKDHSYGEYVFDWGWAEAYQKHGLNYYPKLIIAAPFTPAEGPRILSPIENYDGKAISKMIQDHCAEQQFSGAHILMCNPHDKALLQDHNWHQRSSVQFHWYNYDYTSFDDFLSRFKSRKRKAVKKERSNIQSQNITIEKVAGENISQEQWEFFYYCYQSTYAKRGMQGYINLDGFKLMQSNLAEKMLLVMAYQNHEPIACALYFKDSDNLYGRYWGCVKEVDGLHFEVCYYQGIEYCIENNLSHFDPGTQGEHKISRGFEPVFRYSLHHLQHEGFHHAVGDFVREERKSLEQYQIDCHQSLPFNEQFLPPIKR